MNIFLFVLTIQCICYKCLFRFTAIVNLKNEHISVLFSPFFSPLARSPFSNSALNASQAGQKGGRAGWGTAHTHGRGVSEGGFTWPIPYAPMVSLIAIQFELFKIAYSVSRRASAIAWSWRRLIKRWMRCIHGQSFFTRTQLHNITLVFYQIYGIISSLPMPKCEKRYYGIKSSCWGNWLKIFISK